MRIEYFLCTLLFFFFLHALFYLFLFFLHALFLFSHALFIPFLAWFFFYKYMLLFFQLFLTYLHKKGGVVQLVERMLCTHEVIGSSPIISTSQSFLVFFIIFLRQKKNLLGQRVTIMVFPLPGSWEVTIMRKKQKIKPLREKR